MSKPEPDLEAVAQSLGLLVQRSNAVQNAVDDRAARARLLLSAASEAKRSPRVSPWIFALPAVAAAAALVVWVTLPSALTYSVVGANKDGAYVSAPSDHPVTVHFSDETLLEVAAGSQVRVDDTTRHGARVLLERGDANVHVVHRPQTHWTFAAGPFEVLVTGTRFDLKWDPATAVLDLQMREGSVEIQTPFGAAPVSLRAGQGFHADLQQRSMTTTDAALAPPAVASAPAAIANAPDVASAQAESSGDALGVTSAPSAPLPSTPSSTLPSWRKLVAAGKFTEVLSQANDRGTSACLKACSASDLSALADAARYTGGAPLAAQSLEALRSRYSSSPEGHSAPFLLGRLSERQGAPSAARAWYTRYLSETPSGPYAADALAGKMSITLSLDGKAAAQPIAEDYLRRYPSGVQAATARGILGTP